MYPYETASKLPSPLFAGEEHLLSCSALHSKTFFSEDGMPPILSMLQISTDNNEKAITE